MDRSLESRTWRRGFAAGFAALAVSVAGQMATSVPTQSNSSCPYAAQPGLAERVIDHLAPRARTYGVAQRVALALLGAMLHGACS
jgi:hypothetical protein